MEEIKTLSARLGAPDMYGLLACIVAGRSWDSIQGGVGTSVKSEGEINEIADYAGKLVVDISRLLNKVRENERQGTHERERVRCGVGDRR